MKNILHFIVIIINDPNSTLMIHDEMIELYRICYNHCNVTTISNINFIIESSLLQSPKLARIMMEYYDELIISQIKITNNLNDADDHDQHFSMRQVGQEQPVRQEEQREEQREEQQQDNDEQILVQNNSLKYKFAVCDLYTLILLANIDELAKNTFNIINKIIKCNKQLLAIKNLWNIILQYQNIEQKQSILIPMIICWLEYDITKELGYYIYIKIFDYIPSIRTILLQHIFKSLKEDDNLQIQWLYINLFKQLIYKLPNELLSYINLIQHFLQYITLFDLLLIKELLSCILYLAILHPVFYKQCLTFFNKLLLARSIKHKKIAIYGLCILLKDDSNNTIEKQTMLLNYLKPAFTFSLEIRKILYNQFIHLVLLKKDDLVHVKPSNNDVVYTANDRATTTSTATSTTATTSTATTSTATTSTATTTTASFSSSTTTATTTCNYILHDQIIYLLADIVLIRLQRFIHKHTITNQLYLNLDCCYIKQIPIGLHKNNHEIFYCIKELFGELILLSILI